MRLSPPLVGACDSTYISAVKQYDKQPEEYFNIRKAFGTVEQKLLQIEIFVRKIFNRKRVKLANTSIGEKSRQKDNKYKT